MGQRYQYTFKPNGSMFLNNPIDQGAIATQFDNRVADEVSGTIKLINRLNGDYLYVWVEEMGADFSLTGVTAQSRTYRQFYPRSFNQPHFSITGRASNDKRLNELSEFVRESQVAALHYAQAPLSLQMPYRGLRDVPADHIDYKRHAGWALDGYVPKVRSGAERFNPAPEFSFDFIISFGQGDESGQVGLFQDGKVKSAGRRIMSWMDIIKNGEDFSGEGFNRKTVTDDADITDLAQHLIEDITF